MEIARTLREIPVSRKEFAAFRELIHRSAGIALADDRLALLSARLRKRLLALQLDSFSEYYRKVVEDPTGAELELLIDAITTNVTAFFREPAHFRHLAEVAIPAALSARLEAGELRIWCAGCATGQEAWTLLMTALPILERHRGPVLKLLATDICRGALAAAAAGRYPLSQVEKIPPALRQRFFESAPRPKGETEEQMRVKECYRSRVTFARFNLLSPLPFRKPFHAIFCRNVMIYFDRPVQREVVARFRDVLHPGGFLYVGHSETLTDLGVDLVHRIPACYQK